MNAFQYAGPAPPSTTSYLTPTNLPTLLYHHEQTYLVPTDTHTIPTKNGKPHGMENTGGYLRD